VIDKPAGPTSHDVVADARRILGERRIGHTGTLDPNASGVLPLVVGRATRLARFLSAADKTYDAVVQLGIATDTCDSGGQPVGAPFAGTLPDRAAIDRALDEFRGTFLQEPPAYSAKKIEGRRSYRLARATGAGTAVRPAAAEVTAFTIALTGLTGDRLTLQVHCSAGFYIRSLADDLGRRLGTGAHLTALRRTRSGEATLHDAVPLTVLDGPSGRDAALAALVPMSQMLPRMAAVTLTTDGLRRTAHGQVLSAADVATFPNVVRSPIRLLTAGGDLVGIAEAGEHPGALHPCVVLM
jgi:tRNA pseudouridine55 synthase